MALARAAPDPVAAAAGAGLARLGAATQLADAALAGESTAELAARIAHIARELSGAEAAAVFGRGPSGPVLFGEDGGVPAADLAARTLQSNSSERRSEGVARAVSIPLRMGNTVVGALSLRFAPDKPVALKRSSRCCCAPAPCWRPPSAKRARTAS